MNKAQIKAKKQRKRERDERNRRQWWRNLGNHRPVPTLDEYFQNGGGGPRKG